MRWNRSRWVPSGVRPTAALIGSAWETATTTPPGVRAPQALERRRRCAPASRRTTRRRESGSRSGSAAPCSTPAPSRSVLQLAAGPLAEVALEQPALDRDLAAFAAPRDGRGRLAGPLERRGVDGVDLGQRRDALGHRLGLGRDPRPRGGGPAPAGQALAGGRCLAVAHEQDQRRRRWFRASSRHEPAQPTLSLRGCRLARTRHRRGRRLRRVPAAGGVARAVARDKRAAFRRRGVLGPARARLRRPGRHAARSSGWPRRPTAATAPAVKWTLNPYRGCTHACHYCFARRYQTQF